jgi:hypothetical protein
MSGRGLKAALDCNSRVPGFPLGRSATAIADTGAKLLQINSNVSKIEHIAVNE